MDKQPDDNGLLNFLVATVETIRDEMVTKSDFAQLEERITRLEGRLVAETTAIRGDIERVHLRLDSIERALSARLSQIETEVSRLRSVVYLLIKDKPELLRLLGPEPL